MNQFLITFIALSMVNVIFATIKSILTINGGKLLASLVSGGYFAFYNVMMIFTVAEFPMWQKCAITFVCNVVGVYLVKWGEEKSAKDKLWKIECTIPNSQVNNLCYDLKEKIPFSAYEVLNSKYTVFNIYCKTQLESQYVKECLQDYNAKYFVSESKTL